MSAAELVPFRVPDTLPELAETANREHTLFGQTFETALEHAIAAGEALAAAKRQLQKVAANPQHAALLPEPSIRKALEALNTNASRYGGHTGDFEWYTPAPYIAAAVRVMGGIDLDPASCAVANETVGAEQFFTLEDDGLAQPWRGRVWMNPPYSQPLMSQFCNKLCEEAAYGNVSEVVVLINNTTETAPFQRMAQIAKAICFPAGRVDFWHPDKETSHPQQGQALLYFGENVAAFCAEFEPFGFCVRVDRLPEVAA